MTENSATRSMPGWALPAGIAAVVMLVLAVVLVISDSADESEQTAAVSWHPQAAEPAAIEGASAWLRRSGDGIEFGLATVGLTPGHAYTMWLVVVDHPEACTTSPCPPPEIIGLETVDGQVRFADGLVVDDSGAATFTGEQAVGPISGWLAERIFDNPARAQVLLVINDHGPELLEHMPGMVETYRGGCSDGSPFPEFFPLSALADGEPGPNTCVLTQLATFVPASGIDA